MDPEDIEKTAITTSFGLFEFFRMPFGFRNAGNTFQRFIYQKIHGIEYVFASADDNPIAMPDESKSLRVLTQLFERFDKAGLQLNLNKYKWV